MSFSNWPCPVRSSELYGILGGTSIYNAKTSPVRCSYIPFESFWPPMLWWLRSTQHTTSFAIGLRPWTQQPLPSRAPLRVLPGWIPSRCSVSTKKIGQQEMNHKDLAFRRWFFFTPIIIWRSVIGSLGIHPTKTLQQQIHPVNVKLKSTWWTTTCLEPSRNPFRKVTKSLIAYQGLTNRPGPPPLEGNLHLQQWPKILPWKSQISQDHILWPVLSIQWWHCWWLCFSKALLKWQKKKTPNFPTFTPKKTSL